MQNLDQDEEDIISVESEDGVEYEVLGVPSKVTLPVVDYSGASTLESIDAFPVHHFYIRCEDLKDIQLPLDANPRRPSHSQQVSEMQETLQYEPEDFVKKNNGLTILCNDIVLPDGENPDTGTVTLDFQEGEGVCNGGHTYFAILNTQFDLDTRAAVHIEAIEIPDSLQGAERKSELAGISRARNNNNKLDQRSEADFRDYYDPLKEAMDDPAIVSWREGDTDAHYNALKAEHFIRMLKTMDPTEFSHPIYCKRCDTHKTAATRVGSIHNTWYDQVEEARRNDEPDPLTHLLPLIDDFLWLRDMISYSLKHDDLVDRTGDSNNVIRKSAFWDYVGDNVRNLRMRDYEGEEGLDIPKPLEVMLLGLFRSDIALIPDPDGKHNLVGWFIEPKDLWDNQKIDLLLRYNDYFKEAEQDPNKFKRRLPPFEQDLFQLGTGQDHPEPKRLLRIEDGAEFVRVDGSDSTHWLDQETGRGFISQDEESAPDSAPRYNRQ